MVNFNHAALANFASAAALLAGVAIGAAATDTEAACTGPTCTTPGTGGGAVAQAQSGDIVNNAGGGSRVGIGFGIGGGGSAPPVNTRCGGRTYQIAFGLFGTAGPATDNCFAMESAEKLMASNDPNDRAAAYRILAKASPTFNRGFKAHQAMATTCFNGGIDYKPGKKAVIIKGKEVDPAVPEVLGDARLLNPNAFYQSSDDPRLACDTITIKQRTALAEKAEKDAQAAQAAQTSPPLVQSADKAPEVTIKPGMTPDEIKRIVAESLAADRAIRAAAEKQAAEKKKSHNGGVKECWSKTGMNNEDLQPGSHCNREQREVLDGYKNPAYKIPTRKPEMLKPQK